MTPITTSTDYTIYWETMAASLREQAAQFDFSLQDRRDASYWEIVTPLFEETVGGTPTMNRQEIVQALKTLEEERRQADLPDLRTLLDDEVYNVSQFFHERFLCACGGDHTRLWAWVELSQDQFGVTFYLTEFAGESTLGCRLKTAWNVLRGRSIEFDPKNLVSDFHLRRGLAVPPEQNRADAPLSVQSLPKPSPGGGPPVHLGLDLSFLPPFRNERGYTYYILFRGKKQPPFRISAAIC